MSAAAKSGARKDPKSAPSEARKDPRPRPIGGVRFDLVGKDPRCKYVGVFRGDVDAMQNYEYLGYRPVKYLPDGPRIRGIGSGGEKGQDLEYKGHVILYLPAEEWQAQYDAGQERADMLSKRMSGQAGVRGNVTQSPFVPVENETTDMGDFYEEAR